MEIFEVFNRKIREQYRPEEGSRIDELLRRGDELEARREALQPTYTAAVERARSLEAMIVVPVRAAGPNGNTAQTAARERLLREWGEAREVESELGNELGDLARQVKDIQVEAAELLTVPAVSEGARREARDLVIKRRVMT